MDEGYQYNDPYLERGKEITLKIAYIILAVVLIVFIITLIIYFIKKLSKNNMTQQKFSGSEAFKFGWQTTKKNFWRLLPISLITFFIYAIPPLSSSFLSAISRSSHNNPYISALDYLSGIIFWILFIIISPSILKYALKFVDGQKPTFFDLFYKPKIFFNYFLVSIITTIISYIGFFLLIIPGIIWGIKFQFAGLFVIEGAGPLEALKRSAKLTKGVKLDLFIFNILIVLISLLGIIILIIGIFWAMPTVLLAWVYVYRKLQQGLLSEETVDLKN
jgi:uncharacterized membrane protein